MATKQTKQTKPASPLPTVAAPVAPAALLAAPAPATVALRGGAAVQQVQVRAGAVYRTKAPHNVAWWQAVQAAAGAQPCAVATLTAQPAQGGHAVPAHFVGYCLRRGYLAQVA